MARIRTVKPEAFTSESLATVTVEAERTFFGLLTQADDEGRHRDNPAIIAGVLWPLRAEHTSVHVEDDLSQLAAAGLVCRYTGCDGKRYLHVTGWAEHQKIDKRSQSRMPVCTEHHADHRCGRCGGSCRSLAEPSANAPRPFDEQPTMVPRAVDEQSVKAPGALVEPSPNAPRTLATPSNPVSVSVPGGAEAPEAGVATEPGPEGAAGPAGGEFAAHAASVESSVNTLRALDEGSAPGSRILDLGSSFPTGRDAPDEAGVSAKDLIGEYVASCRERPPGDVIGHLGRVARKLLAEGIAVEHLRAGLRRYAEIQGHPSRLPSLVNDAMNAPSGSGAGLARPGFRSTVPAHRAWTNPADPATAYAEEL